MWTDLIQSLLGALDTEKLQKIEHHHPDVFEVIARERNFEMFFRVVILLLLFFYDTNQLSIKSERCYTLKAF